MSVYTDGSCLGNPGAGGFGAIGVLHDVSIFRVCAGKTYTTNNNMELKAAIAGIENAKSYGWKEFVVYTDSKYVMDGITKWVHGWEKKNWKTSNGGDVKNKELWKKLLSVVTPSIEFKWVKAHNGDKWNEEVDKLARNCAQLVKNV